MSLWHELRYPDPWCMSYAESEDMVKYLFEPPSIDDGLDQSWKLSDILEKKTYINDHYIEDNLESCSRKVAELFYTNTDVERFKVFLKMKFGFA